MASAFRLTLRLLLSASLLSTLLTSCSSVSKGPGGQISKVKYFHLIPTERQRTPDRSLSFERQYLLRGAVTAAEQRERAGQYYSILWKVTDRSQPVTVKFQYRQANTGLEIATLEQTVTDVRRNNWSKFQVTGPAYNSNGRVTSWKVTLEREGQVLASQQSYIWE
jgi:hypothetical protein